MDTRPYAARGRDSNDALVVNPWNVTTLGEVVTDKVQISAAMEAVMRQDPLMGTAVAYYLGSHPEESRKSRARPAASRRLAGGKSIGANAYANPLFPGFYPWGGGA